MSDPSAKPWFAAKRYGVGAGLPVAWQGWVALLVFVCVFTAVSALAVTPAIAHSGIAVFLKIVMIPLVLAVFLLVCAAKTEGGWRWRWGGE